MKVDFWKTFNTELSPNEAHWEIPRSIEDVRSVEDQMDVLSCLALLTPEPEAPPPPPKGAVLSSARECMYPVQSLLLLTGTANDPPMGELCCEPDIDCGDPIECTDMLLPLPGHVLRPRPPDISGGLGRNRQKRDIVDLEKYITKRLTLMAYKNELWMFDAPCWRHLDFHKAISCFRRLLDEDGLSSVLTTSEYREVYRLLLGNPDIRQEVDIEPPPHCLNLRDGTLDLLSMELYPHDPEDGFFTFLDLNFGDIQASNEGQTFEAFVSQIGNCDRAIRQQLLELVALAVTGYEAKVFYVLLGESGTGKTQFGRFLEELLGRKNVESLSGVHDFTNRFTTSALEGKLLATCLDLPDEPLPFIAVGIIKQFVGDDPIKVEAKYKNSHTIYHKPLLLFAGNHPIRIPNISKEQALLNRMVVIPFSNPVPVQEQTPKLYELLLKDAPYIVAQAIQAYRQLYQRNFAVTRVPLPDEYAPQDGREGYQAVTQFVSDCCLFQADREIATKSLYLAYQNYADKNSLATISQIEFARKLSDYLQTRPGVTSCKRVRNGARGYQGMGLRDEWSL